MILILALLAFSCDSDSEGENLPNIPPGRDVTHLDFPKEPDVGQDVEEDMGKVDPFQRTPIQPGVDPDGNPVLDATLDDKESRVGKTTTDEGFHGIFAHCKAGDYKLYNNKAEFCVQGLETNRFEFFHGGLLVDMRRVGDTSEDVFDIWSPRQKLNVFDAEKVYVVSDGSDGGPAVLRADGKDIQIAQIVGALGTTLFKPVGLDISVEYRLYPDRANVEIVTWTSKSDGMKTVVDIGDLIGFGERVSFWTKEFGFDLVAKTDAFIAQGDGHSFGWYRAESSENFTATQGLIPWLLVGDTRVTLEAGQEYATRRNLIVGDGTTHSVAEEIQKLRNQALPSPPKLAEGRKITLQYGDNTPAANRRVEVYNDDEHVAFATTNENGEFLFTSEKATHFFVDPLLGELEQKITMTDMNDYSLDTPATIDVRGAAIDGELTVSVTLVKNDDGSRKVYVVRARHPSLQKVAPGNYTVYADHGMEWDIQTQSVDLTSGNSKQVDLMLTRVLDTDNFIAGDFHQHLEPSLDSEVSVRDRVLDNVGQGVEFVTPTDHEGVTDIQPYIDELDVGDQISTIPGIEISPTHTHMNWFPMEFKANERGRGSIPLAVIEDGKAVRRTIKEMIALGRLLPSDPIVQMNHGRGNSGYFKDVEFDPATSQAMKPEKFTTDFDSMEIVNDEDQICLLVEDWSALLNIGLRITGIANSDTHGLWRGVGENRNYISSTTDDASAIDPQMVKQAIRQNQTTMARFALVDFPDALPGDGISTDTVTAVDIHVRVQTPPYSQVDRILVLANGKIIEKIDVTSNVEDIVDYDETYSRVFTEDTWITFIALGPNISFPINNGQLVFSMPNPIFIDVDGDTDMDGNMFEAIGPGSIDMTLLHDEMPICTAVR